MLYHYQKIEDKFPGYLQELYRNSMRLNDNKDSFQYITDAVMEKLREEGESRDSIEFSMNQVDKCFNLKRVKLNIQHL